MPIADIAFDVWAHVREVRGQLRLVGGQCRRCSVRAFPLAQVCSACGAAEVVEAILSGDGTLYSFSTVHVSSCRVTPYTIGYIDLPEEVRLLATVKGENALIRPDMPVRLTRDANDWFFMATEG